MQKYISGTMSPSVYAEKAQRAQTSHYRCGQNKHDKKTASSYLCCHYAVPDIQHVDEKYTERGTS